MSEHSLEVDLFYDPNIDVVDLAGEVLLPVEHDELNDIGPRVSILQLSELAHRYVPSEAGFDSWRSLVAKALDHIEKGGAGQTLTVAGPDEGAMMIILPKEEES